MELDYYFEIMRFMGVLRTVSYGRLICIYPERNLYLSKIPTSTNASNHIGQGH